MFLTVDRSPGLHQGLRSRVSVGTLARDLTSLASGRLVGSCLQSLLSLCCTLGIVINEKKSDLVPLQTAKYLGMTIDTEAGKVFPFLARVEKFLTVAESFCSMTSPLAQLWQVVPGSPGIARASGPSRSTLDALSAVASQGALVL